MPKLFLYKDFPECKCDPEVLNNGSVSSLKQKCVDFFKKNTSCSNMLCIVSDEENWEVLYPVISDGSGKKEHPKDYRGAGKGLGWNWDSNANNIENHREFTSKLKKHNTFSYISECEPEDSDDIAEMDILENDKNNQPDCELEKNKEIILRNFELFKQVYREKFDVEFESSEDVTMFYRYPADIEEVIYWNKKAKSKNILIDLCAFNEMILGNDKDPDIVILGKNPGAAGTNLLKAKSFFEDVFDELKTRKEAQKQDIFYPLISKDVMEALPWFSNRLIFGSTSDQIDHPAGILSRFANEQSIKQECSKKFAKKIVSLELVPYHTARFQDGKKFIKKFGVVEKVKGIVEKAIARKAVILCPYFGAVKTWLENVKLLENYEFFYTTHFRYGQTNAAQDGNMNIAALRHYSKIDTPREKDENCEALFDRLVELGWKKI